jgi:hypothetical protein
MPTVPPFEEVVTRWVAQPRPLEQVVRDPLTLGTDRLQLERPFARDRSSWTAAGRLRGPRTRVELQITAWPNGAAEVTVRPRGRRLLTWSAGRERRYFDAAHDAATQVAHTLASVA